MKQKTPKLELHYREEKNTIQYIADWPNKSISSIKQKTIQWNIFCDSSCITVYEQEDSGERKRYIQIEKSVPVHALKEIAEFCENLK